MLPITDMTDIAKRLRKKYNCHVSVEFRTDCYTSGENHNKWTLYIASNMTVSGSKGIQYFDSWEDLKTEVNLILLTK